MMKVMDLINAANELKKQNPIYDFTQFNVSINGEEVLGLKLEENMFTFNLLTTVPDGDNQLTEMEQRADLEAEASRMNPEHLDPEEEAA